MKIPDSSNIHRSATQSWSKLGSLLKDHSNAESVFYAQQDGQYELMPLQYIISNSSVLWIGFLIIAQSPKWRLEFVEYKYTCRPLFNNSSSFLAWYWVAICACILTAWVCVCQQRKSVYAAELLSQSVLWKAREQMINLHCSVKM